VVLGLRKSGQEMFPLVIVLVMTTAFIILQNPSDFIDPVIENEMQFRGMACIQTCCDAQKQFLSFTKRLANERILYITQKSKI
jgi:hypothetical protein